MAEEVSSELTILNLQLLLEEGRGEMRQNCSVPAFLNKLWTLVEDPGTDDLISWSQVSNKVDSVDSL